MKNKTQRELEIQKGLEKEIYSKLEKLEDFNDDTFSSTEKLANILEGYMTEVEDIEVENDDVTNNLDEMVILEENEISVEVDDSEVLNEYNAKIHDFNLDTLSDILEQDKIDKEITKEFTEEELDMVENSKFTQEIIPEDNIIDLDEEEILEEKIIEKKPIKEGFGKFEYILVGIIGVLIIFIAFIVLSGLV
jgi:hypothetical protein